MPKPRPYHITVVESGPFRARAATRMTDEERTALILYISANPKRGVLLDGGIRKIRFAVGGQGKSGSIRVLYLYADDSMPLFLLTVFAKNEKDNLDPAELRDLGKVAKQIIKNYHQ